MNQCYSMLLQSFQDSVYIIRAHYFIWQLSAATSCRLTDPITIAHSAVSWQKMTNHSCQIKPGPCRLWILFCGEQEHWLMATSNTPSTYGKRISYNHEKMTMSNWKQNFKCAVLIRLQPWGHDTITQAVDLYNVRTWWLGPFWGCTNTL